MVFNKIDAFHFIKKDPDDLTPKTKENISLEDIKKTWLSKSSKNNVFISAKHKENVNELKKLLLFCI